MNAIISLPFLKISPETNHVSGLFLSVQYVFLITEITRCQIWEGYIHIFVISLFIYFISCSLMISFSIFCSTKCASTTLGETINCPLSYEWSDEAVLRKDT